MLVEGHHPTLPWPPQAHAHAHACCVCSGGKWKCPLDGYAKACVLMWTRLQPCTLLLIQRNNAQPPHPSILSQVHLLENGIGLGCLVAMGTFSHQGIGQVRCVGGGWAQPHEPFSSSQESQGRQPVGEGAGCPGCPDLSGCFKCRFCYYSGASGS